MRKLALLALAVVCAAALLSQAPAQPPGGKDKKEPGKDQPKDFSNAPLVVKMMAFNKKKDGKLTKDEVTDERLHRLFDEADANKDGVVTREELMALAAKMDAEDGGERRGPGGRGPGGPPEGAEGRRPDGPPPEGRRPGGPPRPGQILSPGFQDALQLTADQKKQLEALQKDVDTKLAKILTEEQMKKMKEMPGRGGPPPGRPGSGGNPDK